jgi:hypothetical protein
VFLGEISRDGQRGEILIERILTEQCIQFSQPVGRGGGVQGLKTIASSRGKSVKFSVEGGQRGPMAAWSRRTKSSKFTPGLRA